jgi:lysozyme
MWASPRERALAVSSLREQLIREEGWKAEPYRDSRGFLTIGVGWNLDIHPLPDEVVSLLLQISMGRVLDGLRARIPWYVNLNEPRQVVLEQMAFQMGVAGLMTFKNTLAFVKAGDYAQAATEMLDSRWAKQTPERAHRLAEQMRTGAWVNE